MPRIPIIGLTVGMFLIGGTAFWSRVHRTPPNSPASEAAAVPSPTGTAQLSGEVRNLSPSEAHTLLKSRVGDSQLVVLDVRTEAEYGTGYLRSATLLDYYAPDIREKVEALDKSKTYLVYCRTGRRSAEVVAMMRPLGFAEVYDLAGGITAWTAAGLPVEQ
jgi:rhodanese-related sulfurtransferase